MNWHLTDTCTIQHVTTANDPYGNTVESVASSDTAVACLLVEKSEQYEDTLSGQVSIRTNYKLYLRADQSIGVGDRVTSVVRSDGATATGTYEVLAVIPRRSVGALITFQSCELRKVS